jgi:hypothetical protein
MKQIFTTLILSIYSLVTFAQQHDAPKERKRYEHFKERNISKTYSASGNTLQIDNQFGDVMVSTWDRNEIKVDVHIETSSNDKDIAEKTFNNIDVVESKEGNIIKFKTTTQKNKGNNWNCNNCKNSMNISITVQLPAGNTLKIENSFGSIKMPDYNGAVSLVSKFGSLKTGKLAKAEKVLVEFGKANIKSMSNVNATFKFSTITVENLSGTNKLEMEFCSSSRINLDNDLTGLTLHNSYSTVNLRPASNFSASYSIRTSFGSLKNKTNTAIERTDKPDQYGPDSDRSYEGKSGSGAAKIEIKSSFGTIILGEASAEEMKEKDKKAKAGVKI